MMLITGILLMTMMAEAPAKVTVCTKAEPRRPSPMMAYGGKCAEGYKPVLDKDGKTIMFCVNTVHPKPSECKQVPVPTSSPAPSKQ